MSHRALISEFLINSIECDDVKCFKKHTIALHVLINFIRPVMRQNNEEYNKRSAAIEFN